MNIVTEAIKAVVEINEDVEYIEGLSEDVFFTAETNGIAVNIKFLGCEMWSSEEDLRDFNEELWEPMVDFLRRERDRLISNVERYKGVVPQEENKEESQALRTTQANQNASSTSVAPAVQPAP